MKRKTVVRVRWSHAGFSGTAALVSKASDGSVCLAVLKCKELPTLAGVWIHVPADCVEKIGRMQVLTKL